MHGTIASRVTWRCRGPGGSHRLQNGWGVARRGPWWVRLPYASASSSSLIVHTCHLTHGFADFQNLCFLYPPPKLCFPSSYRKDVRPHFCNTTGLPTPDGLRV